VDETRAVARERSDRRAATRDRICLEKISYDINYNKIVKYPRKCETEGNRPKKKEKREKRKKEVRK